MNRYRYTEIFQSLQGEGTYTGRNTLWLRWFLCNFQCKGFGQPNPADPSTYKPTGDQYDLSGIDDLKDLPVIEYGCDSAYSWSKKYKHLTYNETVSEIADKLEACITSSFNPKGKFLHETSGEEIDFCMTGGEPLMKHTQPGIVELLHEFYDRGNMPKNITIETNATQKAQPALEELIETFQRAEEWGGFIPDERGTPEWFWSTSPKLLHTSGEKFKRAIKPDIMASYAELSNHGHLKFVVNGTKETWNELEEAIRLYRNEGIDWPVYIMPVGATREQQEQPQIADIADEALKRGYHISARVHSYLYGNKMGT